MSRMKIAALTLACLPLVMFTLASCGDDDDPKTTGPVEWGYDGPSAPAHWASLSEEYATCANGIQQSPVDIAGYEKASAGPVSFSYVGDAATVHNDGKFVRVEYTPGNAFSVGQQTFELKSAHLHSPSEHRIDGASFAAELHLVHESADEDLAVVALLFRLGEPSPVVEAVLDAAPAVGDTANGGITLNATSYLPIGPGYYRYDGSKTTPPCHEPVDWYVMSQPKTISPEQIDKLLSLSGGPNNRPVQPIGSRTITANSLP